MDEIISDKLINFFRIIHVDPDIFDQAQLAERQHQVVNQSKILEKFKGIKEKFEEGIGEEQLFPLLSELDFAVEFQKKGFDIELMTPERFGYKGIQKDPTSPDFIGKKDGHEYFVEVVRTASRRPYLELQERLEKEVIKYPLCIHIEFSEQLLHPCFRSEQYEIIDKLINSVSKTIIDLMADYNDQEDEKILAGNTFKFEILQSGKKGYINTIDSGVTLNKEKIFEKIEFELSKKSKESLKWPVERSSPDFYIVAMDANDFQLSPFTFQTLMYGGLFDINPIDFPTSKPKAYYHLKKFVNGNDFKMLNKNYSRLLKNFGYDISSDRIICNFGFFTHKVKRKNFENVTGIIIKWGNTYQYLPNPFSLKSNPNLVNQLNYPVLHELLNNKDEIPTKRI